MKTTGRILLSSFLVAGAAFIATGAEAACVPVLQNCYCTFQVPCPVIDGQLDSEVSELVDSYRELTNATGPESAAADRPSSPVGRGSADAANLAISKQKLRNALRGPDNAGPPEWNAAPIDIQIPEERLGNDSLPVVHALPASGDKIENPNEARSRLGDAYLVQSAPTLAQANEMKAARFNSQQNIAANAYALALQKRNDLSRFAEEENRLLDMMASSQTLGQEIAANSRIRNALTRVQQETAEMLQLYIEGRSHRTMVAEMEPVSPPPANTTAYSRSPADIEARNEGYAALQGYQEYADNIQKAAAAHNAYVSANEIASQRDTLLGYVQKHEDRKAHAWTLEQDIMTMLAHLYQDPVKAWAILQQDLKQDATGYGTYGRYNAAATLVQRILPSLNAQQPQTRYGARKRSSNCGGGRGNNCPEFTVADYTGPTAGMTMVNTYYAAPGEDPYRISPLGLTGGRDGDALSSALLQYYLEAEKRLEYWSDIRRGESASGQSTSAALWTELTTTAPSCLSGPIASTSANFSARPNLFDVSPNCSHFTWSKGDMAGQPISDTHLGGIDRTIWSINQSLAEYRSEYDGPEEIEGYLAAAEAARRESGVAELASKHGLQNISSQVSALDDIAASIRADSAGTTYVPR